MKTDRKTNGRMIIKYIDTETRSVSETVRPICLKKNLPFFAKCITVFNSLRFHHNLNFAMSTRYNDAL